MKTAKIGIDEMIWDNYAGSTNLGSLNSTGDYFIANKKSAFKSLSFLFV